LSFVVAPIAVVFVMMPVIPAVLWKAFFFMSLFSNLSCVG
jgi:hypothetical protein